jgi:FMN phosphatase YigB (HAD superfamily)
MQVVCFFDLDGTLMVNPFGTAVWPNITRELAVLTGLSPKALLHAFNAENMRRQHTQPNDLLTMDWDDIVDTVARRHSVQFSVRVIDLVHQYCQSPHIAVLDDADRVLAELKKPHRKLVVATKGLSKYQFPVLKALGLYDLFDDFLTPDRTGYLKSEAGYYSNYTDNASDDTLFIQIGDHHYDDVIRPKALGFYTIMRLAVPGLSSTSPFERPHKMAQYRHYIPTYREDNSDILPHAIITHLSELPTLIDQIEQEHLN